MEYVVTGFAVIGIFVGFFLALFILSAISYGINELQNKWGWFDSLIKFIAKIGKFLMWVIFSFMLCALITALYVSIHQNLWGN